MVLSMLAGLLGLTNVTPACACSCVGSTPEERYARVDAVFSGEVLTQSVNGGERRVEFRVAKVYKGDVAEYVTITTHLGEASCGASFGSGLVLVFAHGAQQQFKTTLCDGTGLTQVSELPAIATTPPAAKTPPTPTTLPSSAAPSTVPAQPVPDATPMWGMLGLAVLAGALASAGWALTRRSG